jgi:hypothetical protein
MYIVSSLLVQKACLEGLYTHVPKDRCATSLRYIPKTQFVADFVVNSTLFVRYCIALH